MNGAEGKKKKNYDYYYYYYHHINLRQGENGKFYNHMEVKTASAQEKFVE